MKVEGQWEKGVCQQGRWILPNGVFFEGDFLNNKPNGLGTWHFPDGNTCQGVFTQKEREDDDEEEEEADNKEGEGEEEEEEDEEPEEDEEEEEEGEEEEKKKYDLVWNSSLNLLASAELVREIPALE